MMKKTLFLAFAAALLAACAPAPGIFVPDTPTGRITGTVIVTDGSYDIASQDTTVGGTAYHKGDTIYYDYIGNNIEAELTQLKDAPQKYNIVLYRVCFSNHMPVTIDMTIPAVGIDSKGVISGDSIVPYAGILGEYPRYTVRNLTGRVVFDAEGKAGALTLDMLCVKYPTSYQGMYMSEK